MTVSEKNIGFDENVMDFNFFELLQLLTQLPFVNTKLQTTVRH